MISLPFSCPTQDFLSENGKIESNVNKEFFKTLVFKNCDEFTKAINFDKKLTEEKEFQELLSTVKIKLRFLVMLVVLSKSNKSQIILINNDPCLGESINIHINSLTAIFGDLVLEDNQEFEENKIYAKDNASQEEYSFTYINEEEFCKEMTTRLKIINYPEYLKSIQADEFISRYSSEVLLQNDFSFLNLWKINNLRFNKGKEIIGKVVEGFKRGSKFLGIPTANISSEGKYPFSSLYCGVYYGQFILKEQTYKGVLSVGL